MAVPLEHPEGIHVVPDNQQEESVALPTENWKKHAWILAIILLLATMGFLLFIVRELSIQTMNAITQSRSNDTLFLFAGLSLVNSSLTKSIAILSGTAVSFAGIAISFFSHEKANRLVAANNDAAGNNAKIALTAYSPGIFAVVVGAAVIMTAVLFPGKFTYQPRQTVEQTFSTADPTDKASALGLPSPASAKKPADSGSAK